MCLCVHPLTAMFYKTAMGSEQEHKRWLYSLRRASPLDPSYYLYISDVLMSVHSKLFCNELNYQLSPTNTINFRFQLPFPRLRLNNPTRNF